VSAVAPTNHINVTGGRVVLNTGTAPSSAISLGANVKINAGSGSSLITSLDLTDPDNVNFLKELQLAHRIGGVLQVTVGVATGGNIILSSHSPAPTHSAQHPPAH